MTIRDDLEKATKLKIKKNEDEAEYRLRLLEAVSDLSEEKYEALPDKARKWSDKAIADYKEAGEDLKALADFPEEQAQVKEEAEEEEEVDLTEQVDEEEEGEESESTDEDDQPEDDEMTHTDVSESSGRRYKSKAKAKTTAKAAPKAKAKAAAKAPKAKAAKKDGGGQGLDYARSLLAKDIEMSADQLRTKVKAAGFEVSDSTLSTGASGFRAAVRALQKAKVIKTPILK